MDTPAEVRRPPSSPPSRTGFLASRPRGGSGSLAGAARPPRPSVPGFPGPNPPELRLPQEGEPGQAGRRERRCAAIRAAPGPVQRSAPGPLDGGLGGGSPFRCPESSARSLLGRGKMGGGPVKAKRGWEEAGMCPPPCPAREALHCLSGVPVFFLFGEAGTHTETDTHTHPQSLRCLTALSGEKRPRQALVKLISSRLLAGVVRVCSVNTLKGNPRVCPRGGAIRPFQHLFPPKPHIETPRLPQNAPLKRVGGFSFEPSPPGKKGSRHTHTHTHPGEKDAPQSLLCHGDVVCACFMQAPFLIVWEPVPSSEGAQVSRGSPAQSCKGLPAPATGLRGPWAPQQQPCPSCPAPRRSSPVKKGSANPSGAEAASQRRNFFSYEG